MEKLRFRPAGDAADPDRRVLSDGQIKAAQAEASERR
jgi:hypothetical protein